MESPQGIVPRYIGQGTNCGTTYGTTRGTQRTVPFKMLCMKLHTKAGFVPTMVLTCGASSATINEKIFSDTC